MQSFGPKDKGGYTELQINGADPQFAADGTYQNDILKGKSVFWNDGGIMGPGAPGTSYNSTTGTANSGVAGARSFKLWYK